MGSTHSGGDATHRDNSDLSILQRDQDYLCCIEEKVVRTGAFPWSGNHLRLHLLGSALFRGKDWRDLRAEVKTLDPRH